jgi:hypothetical protein
LVPTNHDISVHDSVLAIPVCLSPNFLLRFILWKQKLSRSVFVIHTVQGALDHCKLIIYNDQHVVDGHLSVSVTFFGSLGPLRKIHCRHVSQGALLEIS